MRFGEIFTTSLYKFRDYHKLLKVSGFKTFLYIVFLALIMVVGAAVVMFPMFLPEGGLASMMEEHLPDFSITDGELKCDNVLIDEDDLYIEIDTSKTGVLPLPDGYAQAMTISRTDINILNGMRTTTGSLSDIPDFSKTKAVELFRKYAIPIYLALLGLMLFSLIINTAVSILLYAALTMLSDKLLVRSGLRFGEVFKITVFSMTFAVVMNMLLTLIGLGRFDMIAPFITLFYAIKGVINCRDERRKDGIVIAEF